MPEIFLYIAIKFISSNFNLQLLSSSKHTNDDDNIQFLNGIKYRMRYINKRSRRGVENSNKFAFQMREGASV